MCLELSQNPKSILSKTKKQNLRKNLHFSLICLVFIPALLEFTGNFNSRMHQLDSLSHRKRY